jgi:hypothetical protein
VEGCAHAQPEVAQNLPLWGLLPGSEGFPRFFFSTEGWGDLYDVRVIYLAWLLELAIASYILHGYRN